VAKLWADLQQYVKGVFLQGGRIVFTAFDILGIVLWFSPRLAGSLGEHVQLARALALGLFLFSFLVANFLFVRGLLPSSLTEAVLHLYPHGTKTSSAIRMKYEGKEPAKDLRVTVHFSDGSGEERELEITQFFPANDPQLLYRAGPITSLEAGEEAFFYPLGLEDSREGNVTVRASITGAKTGTTVTVTRAFTLAPNRTWLIS